MEPENAAVSLFDSDSVNFSFLFFPFKGGIARCHTFICILSDVGSRKPNPQGYKPGPEYLHEKLPSLFSPVSMPPGMVRLVYISNRRFLLSLCFSFILNQSGPRVKGVFGRQNGLMSAAVLFFADHKARLCTLRGVSVRIVCAASRLLVSGGRGSIRHIVYAFLHIVHHIF